MSIHAKFRTTRVKLKVTDVFVVASSSPTEWQRMGDQIDAAFIFARPDFVSVLRASHHAGPSVRFSDWLDPVVLICLKLTRADEDAIKKDVLKWGELTCQ
jgi:hypothetical protein